MKKQQLLQGKDNYRELDEYFQETGCKKIMLVCGSSISYMNINIYFKTLEYRMGIKVVMFSDFQPNPQYESVVKGVDLFQKEHCDTIVAVGGGSAMDVAKCIKLYANMDSGILYLRQSIVPNQIPLITVPTTAGTGSEATRYAVIYYNGAKQSITDNSCIPDAVLFDAGLLESLPVYQRKATMLDAFCHAIESFWSINSTAESRKYSKEAIELILSGLKGYLKNDSAGNQIMLKAAYIAGKAINITQTTAGHAMCYKLTGLYGVPHGCAAAMCVSALWDYMLDNVHKCIDPRGEEYLLGIFDEIAVCMGCSERREAVEMFKELIEKLEIPPLLADEKDYTVLRRSVNEDRLKNNPVDLHGGAIDVLYHRILE